MELSVGPLESYIPGSTWFDLTKYSDLGIQERVSVKLTASNLWLVDESQLNFQDTTAPPVVLPAEGMLYESPVQIFDTTASTLISTVGGSYVSDVSSVTTTLPLETGGTVNFSGLNGEIDSDAASITNTSGQGTGTLISTTDTVDLSIPTNSDSPLFTTAYPNSNPPSTAISTSDTPPDLFPPTAIIVDPPGTVNPPGTPASSIPGTPTGDTVPVPFDTNMTVGILALLLLIGRKIYKPLTSTQTQRKRDRNGGFSTLELTQK